MEGSERGPGRALIGFVPRDQRLYVSDERISRRCEMARGEGRLAGPRRADEDDEARVGDDDDAHGSRCCTKGLRGRPADLIAAGVGGADLVRRLVVQRRARRT